MKDISSLGYLYPSQVWVQ